MKYWYYPITDSQTLGCLDAYFIKRINWSIRLSGISKTINKDKSIRDGLVKGHNDLHRNQ